MRLPRSAHAFVSLKGMQHQSDEQPMPTADSQDTIILAVAKTRVWIDDLAPGRIQSFAVIARSEGKVEKHNHLLAPLAFVPVSVLTADADGTFRGVVSVAMLARSAVFVSTAFLNRLASCKPSPSILRAPLCRRGRSWLSAGGRATL
jgi:hypothetical protein